jgi:hypothetical protein
VDNELCNFSYLCCINQRGDYKLLSQWEGFTTGMPFVSFIIHLGDGRFQPLIEKEQSGKKASGIKVSSMINILHLFFVDDVLILTKVDLLEWREIKNLIVLFCKASGLQVNSTKTTMHFEGLSETELLPFRSFLPFTFTALHTGFKYLGFHLKTGPQRVADWSWLINKIGKEDWQLVL